MLFMLWTYLASVILLIGAEFASEYEKGRHKQPDERLAHSGYAHEEARART